MRKLLAAIGLVILFANPISLVMAQSSPQFTDAKTTIDAHFTRLKELSKQKADKDTLNKALEEMAGVEAELWGKLSESQQRQAKKYAENKIKSSPSLRKYLLSAAPPSKPKPLTLTLARVGGPCR